MNWKKKNRNIYVFLLTLNTLFYQRNGNEIIKIQTENRKDNKNFHIDINSDAMTLNHANKERSFIILLTKEITHFTMWTRLRQFQLRANEGERERERFSQIFVLMWANSERKERFLYTRCWFLFLFQFESKSDRAFLTHLMQRKNQKTKTKRENRRATSNQNQIKNSVSSSSSLFILYFLLDYNIWCCYAFVSIPVIIQFGWMVIPV